MEQNFNRGIFYVMMLLLEEQKPRRCSTCDGIRDMFVVSVPYRVGVFKTSPRDARKVMFKCKVCHSVLVHQYLQ